MSGQTPPVAMQHVWYKDKLDKFLASGKTFEIVAQGVGLPSDWARDETRRQLQAERALPSQPKNIVVLDSSFNPPTLAHMDMAINAIRDVGLRDTRLLLLLAVNNADKAPKPASFEQRCAMMGKLAEALGERICQPQERDQWSNNIVGCEFGVDIALTTLPYFHEKSAALAVAEREFYDQTIPGRPAEQLFLVGYDTIVRIFNPRYYKPTQEDGITIPPEAGGPSAMVQALGPMFRRARLRVTLRSNADWGTWQEQVAYMDGIMHGDRLQQTGGLREWASRITVESQAVGNDLVPEEGGKRMDVKDVGAISSTKAREAAAAQDWVLLGALVPVPVLEWIRQEAPYE